MNGTEAALTVVAGVLAGGINAVVGSGTLVTFPALLAFGYPPVVANASNTVGLVPGSLAGAYAYRAEIAGQRRLLLRLAAASLLGGVTGAGLLLLLPAAVFQTVVPVLICLALVLVVAQPWLARRLRGRPLSEVVNGARAGETQADGARTDGAQPGETRAGGARAGGALLLLGVFATGVYGGYFGAAQGVLLLGLLGVLTSERLQRLNGIKNLLTGGVNAVAALVFLASGHVAWAPALLIAAGSVAGGFVGGRYGRRLPEPFLRGLIVVVGLTAVARMLI